MNEGDRLDGGVADLDVQADQRPGYRKVSKPAENKIKPESGKSRRFGKRFGFLLLLVVALSAGAGWQIYLLNSALTETRMLLSESQERLNSITGEVALTGENINQSGNAIRSELKEVNSEIRKLWDVSNKRNKEWILINKDNVVKALAQAKKANESAGKLSGQLDSLTDKQKAAEQKAEKNFAEIKEQLADMEKLLQEQRKMQGDLAEQLDSFEQIERSVNQFRIQTNRKIQQLEETVRELNRASEESLVIQ